MNETSIPLFVGDEITESSEIAMISRLRRDLDHLGVRATLYANFFPPTRRSQQVDLFVRTDHRTAHIEIKGLRPDYPVRARANGPWVQKRPDDSERSFERNFGRQTLAGTYAISDALGDLAARGVVKSITGRFYRHIDSIVGIWESIPEGSVIEAPPYVTVLGYDDVLKALTSCGPKVPWSDSEWDSFVRELGLYQPESDSESQRRRRSSLESIKDYRVHARRILAESLDTFVDVGVTNHHGDKSFALDISRELVTGRVLAVVGSSGIGKTFLAQDLAVRHCDDGRLVVWIRASDYEMGKLSRFLARAMAPFSAERWNNLVEGAQEFGVAITVVLDGLNECPNAERRELLKQLGAFTLRHPAGVLITSTTADALPDTLDAVILQIREPDADARLAILASHGAKHPDCISDQFRAPYDLAIAAECEGELGEHASVAELHSAYIWRSAPTEQIRGGLRSLAGHLHAQLRTSLPLNKATTILNNRSHELTSNQIEDVLQCWLLVIGSHRVRFRHDLVGQFFAAEDVVCSATSGQSLGQLLGVPANVVLAEAALGIEADHTRVWEALTELHRPDLVFSVVTARYGADLAVRAFQEIRAMLRRATAITASTAMVIFEEDSGFFGRWVTEHGWTAWERTLLASTGRGLARGMFVDEVCELIDRTDEFCLGRAQQRKAAGGQAAVSQVVGATYIGSGPAGGHGLAASYVVAAFEQAAKRTRYSPDRPPGLARRFAADASARSWGRFYMAVLASDSRDASDQAHFASLLRRSWDAEGYHLRLQALEAAEFFGGSNEPHRSEILDVLLALAPDHWALQGTLVQVLARFGDIENTTPTEQLLAQIRAVLSRPEDSQYCQQASGIVSSQFEDEAIVGPYCEAVDSLTSQEKVRLFTMAARDSDPSISMFLDWTLDQLVGLVPTGDTALDAAAKAAFAPFLEGPSEDNMMCQPAVNACLTAIRGWAKFEAALPPETAASTLRQRNWRLVASLLLDYERHDKATTASNTWDGLLLDPWETILTLTSLEHAEPCSNYRPLGHLVKDYPGPLRLLFEWALENLAQIPTDRSHRRDDLVDFVMSMLGAVGNESTAARLHIYTLDPDLAAGAVYAIRAIHRRVAP